ncbi:MAG TPA: hypothetical protein VLH08_19455 [Acidobacteriota bacterium]|nr:hypothetical protein [Acidobacteriota bacterium]
MKKFTFLIPPVLLIIIALHQIYLSKVHDLSPWKGGGFGMFSSTDLGPARYVRVFLYATERSEELEIPDSLVEAAQKAATFPSDSLLDSFAEKIVQREDRYHRPVDSVRIEIWRTQFDRVTLKPQEQKVRNYVFQVDQTSR